VCDVSRGQTVNKVKLKWMASASNMRRTMQWRALAAYLLVLAAPCCGVNGHSPSRRHHRGRLLGSRISNFDSGSQGWRILPSLPTPSEDGSASLVLPVSADDAPAYFLAPNDLVSEVKRSAALRPVPDISVRVSLEVPASCWTSAGWRCTFRFAVVGAECSLHRVFSPPAPLSSSVQGPSTVQIEANLTWFEHAPVDAEDWASCSEILEPDGICDTKDVQTAMRASLSTLRFLLIAVDVSPAPVTPAPPAAGYDGDHVRFGHVRFSTEGESARSGPRAAAIRQDECSDQVSWDGGFGNCTSYARGGENEGFCTDDHACTACACSCSQDHGCLVAAGGAGGSGGGGSQCSDDAGWDGDYGGCLTYAPGGDNEGYCVDDGACQHCSCSCAAECGAASLAMHVPVRVLWLASFVLALASFVLSLASFYIPLPSHLSVLSRPGAQGQ